MPRQYVPVAASRDFYFIFSERTSSVGRVDVVRCHTFSFCSLFPVQQTMRDIRFFGLATNTLNVRNNAQKVYSRRVLIFV